MSSKRDSMYGISRMDDEVHNTHAWRVSLRRRRQMYVKNFPDLKCGGRAKALRLAQRYRDELLRKVRPMTRQEFSSIKRRHNQSGVVGVCRFASGYRLKDGRMRYSWYWEAIWPTKLGESETVRYSVNKFGERGAFEKACAARKRGFKKIEGVIWSCRR